MTHDDEKEITIGSSIYRRNERNRVGTVIRVITNHFGVFIPRWKGTIYELWPRSQCHLAD